MIRNAFASTVNLSKSIHYKNFINESQNISNQTIKIRSIDAKINSKFYTSLLLTNRYHFMKHDVTIDYKKNYYEILKVNEKATLLEIKKSFYKLAKESHPDTSKGNQEQFKKINEAYNVLSHQERRKLYDTNRYRKTQNPNDQKAQQQSNYSSASQQRHSQGQQNYKSSQQYAQRQQQAYYHYSRGQWQQFRSGYKYHINPQSQYYANLTNNVSGQKLYSNFKRKAENKTQKQEEFLKQMEMYFQYLKKIQNKKKKDLEQYHRKMEELERQLFEERKNKFAKTLIGKAYFKITEVMEKVSDKLQTYITKQNQKQK